MKENYRNDVDGNYEKSIKNENNLSLLFFGIIVITIINIFLTNEYIIYLLIVLNLIYVAISLYNDMIVKNSAESERRKTLLAHAFSINITSKKTNGYYNNEFSPSVKKLGVDSFESTLFTKKNLSLMILSEGIKTFIIFIIWIIIITKFKNDELFYNLTQTFFSVEVLLKFIKIIYYYVNVSKIYDNFYQLFVTRKYNEKKDQALVLKYVMDYECLKTYCHTLLPSKIFEKINDDVSIEWDNIKKDIK